MSQPKLSAVVHTKNSASTLEAALKSLSFADEIVLIDMHSTDDTLKIAKKYTKKIYQHTDVGYADPARNFGISKTTGEWIVVLDADETVPLSLQEVIADVLLAPAADVYWVPRKNRVFGQWIQKTGWWPDYQPRLFRKGCVQWQTGVHRMPDITGTTLSLPADETRAIVHENYTSVAQFIEKLNVYTTLHAQEQPTGLSGGHFSSTKALEVFAQEFAKRALAQDGIEDGLHGVSLSLLQALYETTSYIKEWEAAGFPRTVVGRFDVDLARMMRIWDYWWADYQVRHTRGPEKMYWRWRRKRASV